jgi:hypothetical protein
MTLFHRQLDNTLIMSLHLEGSNGNQSSNDGAEADNGLDASAGVLGWGGWLGGSGGLLLESREISD